MYHREDAQEDFLVLSGECLLIVEGEERPLKAWDFVHCPAWTEHVFVGAGDGPCVLARDRRAIAGPGLVYPVDEAALPSRRGCREGDLSGRRALPTRASPRTRPIPCPEEFPG